MVETITRINGVINNFAWGPFMLLLLVGTGIYITIRVKFIQTRKFGFIMKSTLGSLFKKSDTDHGDNLSPFQAVTTALAGTVGTGNIAGVTGAIFVGGPGAVFWMWFAAFFGMVTKYAEIVLAVKYREKGEDGKFHGGPMYYIQNGLGKNWKWLAYLFAILGGLACFGIGNISQSNEIAGTMKSLFNVSPLITGIALAVISGIVIIGGVKRIGMVTSYLVPFMSIFYILSGIAIIILRISDIPGVLGLIFREAFSFKAIEGGFMGVVIMNAMKQGFARGVFSNEAGLGSAPIAHAASSTEVPCEQGMWGVFEVFVDTIVICTITCLAVLLSGVTGVEGGLSAFASKGEAAATAFNAILPGNVGGIIIQVSLLFFALSTIIGWSYYGERCWGYLTKDNKVVNIVFKVIFVLVCIVGATGNGTLMWDISDTLNGLMAIPNLIALLLLSGIVIKETNTFFDEKANKIED